MINVAFSIKNGEVKGGMSNQKSTIQEVSLSITQLELFKKKQIELFENLLGEQNGN